MPTPLIDSLIASGELVLYHDYRSGHALDLSGYTNNGDITNCQFVNDGLRVPDTFADVEVTHSAEMVMTAFTFVFMGDFKTVPRAVTGTPPYFTQKTGSGTRFDIRYNTATNQLNWYDGTSTRTFARDIYADHCVAVSGSNGQVPNLYSDGATVTAGSGVIIIGTGDGTLYLGNQAGRGRPLNAKLEAILWINRVLTATEHAQIYSELANMKWPKKVIGRAKGEYGAELLNDGDMEAAGTAAWTGSGAPVLSKQVGAALAGDQVLRIARNASNSPSAYQAVLTQGHRYRIKGWARGDGTYLPRVYVDGTYQWTGTVATTWQWFDFVLTTATAATAVYLGSNMTAAGYVEYDNVSVTEEFFPQTIIKSDWHEFDSNVTFAAGARLEGTPWIVDSGTYQVDTATIEGELCKVFTCVTAGILRIPNAWYHEDPFHAAYGTWNWWLRKDAASFPIMYFINTTAAVAAGYAISISNAESIRLLETGIGNKFVSVVDAIVPGVWSNFHITRRQYDSQFSVYLDGVLVDASVSGTNPIADATTTTSTHMLFDMDAGDQIAFADLKGEHNLRKLHGVIAP